jgi:hypothetical protein
MTNEAPEASFLEVTIEWKPGFSRRKFMINSAYFNALSRRYFMKSLMFSLMFLGISALVYAQMPAQPTVKASSPAGAVIPKPVSAAHAPKIVCAHPNFDFHDVDEGGDIIHLFKISNKGKSTLSITNVSTSCGCTAAVVDKKEIPPGGHGVIKATYHTQGRPGHATKVITVTSNDPKNPNFQLKLDMTVVREIEITPEKVYLYNIQHGQPQTATVKLVGKPKLPLEIIGVQSSSNSVTVSKITPYVEEATHRSGATLEVDVPATKPFGPFTDTLKVQTNSKKKPEVDIDVWGEVVGKFTYQPHSINFAPKQTNSITIPFTAQDAKKFVIRNVESVNHLVRPSVKKVDFGNGVWQYQVVIDPPKSLPAKSDGKDTIKVTTNDLEQPLITIDVQVQK